MKSEAQSCAFIEVLEVAIAQSSLKKSSLKFASLQEEITNLG